MGHKKGGRVINPHRDQWQFHRSGPSQVSYLGLVLVLGSSLLVIGTLGEESITGAEEAVARSGVHAATVVLADVGLDQGISPATSHTTAVATEAAVAIDHVAGVGTAEAYPNEVTIVTTRHSRFGETSARNQKVEQTALLNGELGGRRLNESQGGGKSDGSETHVVGWSLRQVEM